MMDNLIVISGEKRHGKDTIADYLVVNYGYRKFAFATIIKKVAMVLFGWTEKIFSDELKEVVDVKYGISPRQFLQTFGTDYMRVFLRKTFPQFDAIVGQNFWLIRTLDAILESGANKVVISDCRFHNEVDYTKRFYPAKSRLYIVVTRNDLPQTETSLHSSETEISTIYRDVKIHNEVDSNFPFTLYEKIELAMTNYNLLVSMVKH